MTKFYVDALGGYIGGFDGAVPPEDAIEVPDAPASAFDTWTGTEWQPAPAGTPQTVTRRQALQALFLAGKLDLVAPAIEANFQSPQKELALIEWEESLDFFRNRPLVHAMGTLLNLTESEIDDLFITASTL